MNFYATLTTVKCPFASTIFLFVPWLRSNFVVLQLLQVYVTSSFRLAGHTPSGAIVPPALHSNHFVGHAIDFNLETPNGYCNSKCLEGILWNHKFYSSTLL